ncbi:DUF4430 domain-containing protein [Schinkia sp. CFF1]
MRKFFRMTVLTIVMFAQLLAGVNMGVSAETPEDTVSDISALSLISSAEKVEVEDSSYGPYINVINGLESAGTYYWAFYVNDEEASVGAGAYEPNVGETLSFRYKSWEDNTFTTEETIKIVGLESDSTALSLLQKEETVETMDSAWGPMITSINGLAAAGTYYWAFYVNGEEASVGAASYKPKAGETLTFKYKSYAGEPDVISPGSKITIAGLPISGNPPDEGTTPENSCEQLSEGTTLEKSVKWIQCNNEIPTLEEALALRQLGNSIPKSYIQEIENNLKTNNGDFTKVTDLEKAALGLIIIDKDPTNFNGINLIEKIYNHDNLTMQGLNGVIYGLLAIDSKGFDVPNSAKWTREKFIQYILDNQLSDGGWSLDNKTSDVDMTAMALSSLSKYQDIPEVKTAIEKAVLWLEKSQQQSGAFLSIKGQENSQSTAQVIIALSTLGMNPIDEGFTKEKNVYSSLLSFQNSDGGFSNLKSGNSELVSTGQALLALVSYERLLTEKSSVYNLTNLPTLVVDETSGNSGTSPTTPGETKKQTITISVRSHESTILSNRTIEVDGNATALSALVDVLEENGIAYETSGYGSTAYVAAINGLAEFDHGPTSGWKYSVNGYFPGSGAGTYKLSDGDQLEWVYEVEGVDPSEMPSSPVSNVVLNSFDSTKLNVVLNKEQKMSSIDAQKLKEALSSNTVKLEKTAVPTEETVISDSKVDEAKIVIPKEALQEQKTIKIEELATEATGADKQLKSSVYEFSPKGTKFEKPVYISINVPIENDDLDNLVMAWLDEEKNQWIQIPTVIDAKTGTVTGKVDHFTKFAVIKKLNENNKLDVANELNKVTQYLKTDQTQSEWEDFGFARLGQADTQAVLAGISKKLKETDGFFRKITDYERYALTVQALGGDPTNIGGYDLMEKIYNNERMTMQGTNGLIFALIALDSGNYQAPQNAKWNREKILAEILANQNVDGGFTLVNGEASDVDMTSMAISSLVNYKEQPQVKSAIDKAIAWLSKAQQASGGFIADGKENSESASQVIMALTAAGIDPQGESFTKASGNVISNLLSYQTKDGGFANVKNDASNQIASEQALLALIALDHFYNNKNSIYQFTSQDKTVVVSKTIPAFADRKEISSYALQSVNEAFDKEIMYGVGQNPLRFAPQQSLTRAQFTAILVKLLEGEEYAQNNVIFNDVKPGQWYYGVVMRAQQLGIIGGTSKTTFSPNKPITREQVAVILARAFDLVSKQDESKTTIYSDISKLSQFNQAAIQALYDKNLMKGYKGNLFKPNDLVTREMGAVLATRIDEKF